MIRSGLPRLSIELESLIQPSIRIGTQPVSEDSLPVGASKFGGQPDLPPEITWPLSATLVDVEDIPGEDDTPWTGIPLAFLAQLNVPDVAEHDVEGALPSSGMLYFFLEVSDETNFGSYVEERDSWRVLYYDGDSSVLVRTPYPIDLPEEGRFSACKVRFGHEITVPPFESFDYEKLNLSKGIVGTSLEPMQGVEQANADKSEENSYGAIVQRLYQLSGGDTPAHRLLGYPDQIQGDLQKEAEVDSKGLNWDEVSNSDVGVSQWRLLLQIDTDEECGWCWGDAGRVYYLIQSDALRARDFSRVWTIVHFY
ncbi:MAG TPA: YwqG family protein [Chloroflexia bacterium]